MKAVETGVMYACLARVTPDHPSIDRFLAYAKERRQYDGIIRDQSVLAEHAYTVAYPLAAIGHARNDPRLIQEALQQLRLRRDRLRIGGQIYGRSTHDGYLDQKNDARAIGLYLLGTARCLALLPEKLDSADDLKRDAQLVAHWVANRQRPDGLWSTVISPPKTPEGRQGPKHPEGRPPSQSPEEHRRNPPENSAEVFEENTMKVAAETTPTDTNSSAALAAALSILIDLGLAVETAPSVQRAVTGLFRFLTPDGMLAGAMPAYKVQGGEALAKTSRRVISQAAMGFTGQLLASMKARQTREAREAEEEKAAAN